MTDLLPSSFESRTGLTPVAGVRLADHTSFGIGGPADWFVEVATPQALGQALGAARALAQPVLILGGGTNLLVSDDGFRGLVVKPALQRLEIDRKQQQVRVGAGVATAALVDALIAEGLGGLEFAAGLPGTVGGGVAGNAGCFGHALSDFLIRATVVESSGRTIEVSGAAWFGFAYRHSNLLAGGAVLAEATFAVRTDDPVRLRDEADRHLAIRRDKHPPPGTRTAGSYFKNLPPKAEGELRQPAGALLDRVGAKALSVGDAAVFERHANIIVNRGRATARDVLALAALMKRRVQEQFGVTLEEEVRFVGRRPAGL